MTRILDCNGLYCFMLCYRVMFQGTTCRWQPFTTPLSWPTVLAAIYWWCRDHWQWRCRDRLGQFHGTPVTWDALTLAASHWTVSNNRSIVNTANKIKWYFRQQIANCWPAWTFFESLEKEMVQGCVPGYRNRGGQMTSPSGLDWRSMKRLQQRKIVIVGDGYYAPPTLLMEEGTERRRPRRTFLLKKWDGSTVRRI